MTLCVIYYKIFEGYMIFIKLLDILLYFFILINLKQCIYFINEIILGLVKLIKLDRKFDILEVFILEVIF